MVASSYIKDTSNFTLQQCGGARFHSRPDCASASRWLRRRRDASNSIRMGTSMTPPSAPATPYRNITWGRRGMRPNDEPMAVLGDDPNPIASPTRLPTDACVTGYRHDWSNASSKRGPTFARFSAQWCPAVVPNDHNIGRTTRGAVRVHAFHKVLVVRLSITGKRQIARPQCHTRTRHWDETKLGPIKRTEEQ